MEKSRPVKKELEGKVFFLARADFVFLIIWLQYFSLLCILTWRVKICVSLQGKDVYRRNESTIIFIINGNVLLLVVIVSFFMVKLIEFCFQTSIS